MLISRPCYVIRCQIPVTHIFCSLCRNVSQLFRSVGQQAFGSIIALSCTIRRPNACHGCYARSLRAQLADVRSAVRISSRRNGLSICRRLVSGTCGPARPADIGSKIQSIYQSGSWPTPIRLLSNTPGNVAISAAASNARFKSPTSMTGDKRPAEIFSASSLRTIVVGTRSCKPWNRIACANSGAREILFSGGNGRNIRRPQCANCFD